MHFKNGREAKEGDPAVAQPSYPGGQYRSGRIEQLATDPNCTSCNARLVYPLLSGNAADYVTISELYHAEDAFMAIDPKIIVATPPAAPAAPADNSSAAGAVATLLVVLLLLVGISAKAQTNVTTVPTFFGSVQAYFTSFNTNYLWTGVMFDAETGYKQVTGVNAASFADINYHIGDAFEAVGTIQYSGVGSAINGGEIGIGYAINHYDTRLTADLLGGYDLNRACGEIEPKLEVKKKLTTNTYASVGMSLPIFFNGGFNSQPTFWTGLGFSF